MTQAMAICVKAWLCVYLWNPPTCLHRDSWLPPFYPTGLQTRMIQTLQLCSRIFEHSHFLLAEKAGSLVCLVSDCFVFCFCHWFTSWSNFNFFQIPNNHKKNLLPSLNDRCFCLLFNSWMEDMALVNYCWIKVSLQHTQVWLEVFYNICQRYFTMCSCLWAQANFRISKWMCVCQVAFSPHTPLPLDPPPDLMHALTFSLWQWIVE